jgi:uncharacterized membrane protein YphA (DoxX/SURF4 family)
VPGAFPIVPALILAAVLIAGAIGKLRHPDDLAGWAELGVPRALRRQLLLRLHPWAEIALGLALALLGGLLGLLAALAGVALMLAYTALVWRAWSAARRAAAAGADDDAASCACFGRQRPVTRLTVARNLWLLAVAVAAASGTWTTPLGGGPLAAGLSAWGWIVGLGAAAVTTALILWPDGAEQPSTSAAAAPGLEGDPLDYIRTRTPAVPVTQADGTIVNLRALSMKRPILLLAISDICGACEAVIERVPEWRELLPEVDVRMLLVVPPESSRLTELAEPQTLHDLNGYVRDSISEWATPAAILLGADGMLAGGPVVGVSAVFEFVGDVYESLHDARPPAGQTTF